VLMDIQMPVLDGLSATRRIRELGGRCRTLPILAMTAHAMGSDREKSLAAGMNDHVTKPLDPDRLRQTLERWLDSAAAAGDPAPAAAALPVIEGLDVAAAMNRMAGNRQLYRQLLAAFQKENTGVVEAIRQALAAGDAEIARRLTHTLKGVSGNIGAMAVHAAARHLEAAISDGRGDVEECLKNLADCLHPLLGRLAAMLPEVAAAAPGRSASSGDGPVVRQTLKHLRQLLKAHDLLAEDVFQEVRHRLVARAPAETEKLAEAIDRFDFAAALAVLDGMLGRPDFFRVENQGRVADSLPPGP